MWGERRLERIADFSGFSPSRLKTFRSTIYLPCKCGMDHHSAQPPSQLLDTATATACLSMLARYTGAHHDVLLASFEFGNDTWPTWVVDTV